MGASPELGRDRLSKGDCFHSRVLGCSQVYQVKWCLGRVWASVLSPVSLQEPGGRLGCPLPAPVCACQGPAASHSTAQGPPAHPCSPSSPPSSPICLCAADKSPDLLSSELLPGVSNPKCKVGPLMLHLPWFYFFGCVVKMLAYSGGSWEMPKGNFGNLIYIFTASWVGYGENGGR